MYRYLAVVAISLGIIVPSLALAQTPGNGVLSVYVQVINPATGSVYSYPYNTIVRNPGDFSVSVSGNNPSPSTFWGSQNGIQVSLNPGTYAVTVTGNQYNFTPSYSQGCNGTMAAGGTASCIVTMQANYNYYPYPSLYPYPNQLPPLTCQPQSQTAGLRQNVQFNAVGGVGGTYNWQTPGRAYPNAGPVLTVSFDQTGSQLVVVTNATQSATCVVNIQNTYNPVQPTYPYGTPGYTSYTNPTISPTYYPHLPNTGVEPLSAAQIAIALALLGACAAVAAPYARKAFAIVTR